MPVTFYIYKPPYEPPAPNEVDFTFPESYEAPAWDSVDIDFNTPE